MKKVLVVDDSEVNLYLFQAIFKMDPEIQVDIESNSTKAISRLREGYPDVLVLDLMMPHIDGFELLHQIKADPGINKIPILIVSARQDSEAYNRVMDFDVQGYIKKPIQMTEVESKIREIIFSQEPEAEK